MFFQSWLCALICREMGKVKSETVSTPSRIGPVAVALGDGFLILITSMPGFQDAPSNLDVRCETSENRFPILVHA